MENELTDKIIELETRTETPGDETEKKRGRGRPKKDKFAELEKPVPPVETFDISGMKVLSTIMSMVVLRLPNPLPLTNEEGEMIDKFGDKVLNKYLGTDFKYGDEIILGFSLLMVVYPRVKEVKKENETTKEN